jgi:hypothetical protein
LHSMMWEACHSELQLTLVNAANAEILRLTEAYSRSYECQDEGFVEQDSNKHSTYDLITFKLLSSAQFEVS